MIISKKKKSFAVSDYLRRYLKKYERDTELPLRYSDLLRFTDAFPLLNKYGEDTLWESVVYPQYMMEELNRHLTLMYALLKTDGDITVMEHLYVDRIDYCTFGNSKPFRVRIVNHFNDNHDYFYVKMADASRVYGLELEHILSPNRINYLVHEQTLIEEHIAGIPGDDFIRHYLGRPSLNKVRIAKEFVKFNERCYVKLLGDMRSYNYVIDITPDFDEEQYRVRAIDFDQQCYEGHRKMYLPQFFKENNPVVQLCLAHLTPETVRQYQYEERTLMAKRVKSARHRMKDLIESMQRDTLSLPEKVEQLRRELQEYHQNAEFARCQNMGDLLRTHLKGMLADLKPWWRSIRP
ncbi:MAG: hypothetical protein HC913_12425 [Microscillaceae bacterium]|nr:hypothetical protein [Microscillaceae bacterium]